MGPNKEESLEKIAEVTDAAVLNGTNQSRCSSIDSKEHGNWWKRVVAWGSVINERYSVNWGRTQGIC